MKKILIFLLVIMSTALSLSAREPYGDYIARYIVTSSNGTETYHSIYNPIKITHYGLMVKNTNAGTKTWEAKYQGPIRYHFTSPEGSVRFHNFYLVHQRVEFNISDIPFAKYNGKYYYVIIFDGQIQLAESI